MLGSSWFTKLSAIALGLLGLLLGFPAFTGAITAWSHHTPVDWRSVLTATGFFVVTAGLAAAKQFNVHGGTMDSGRRPDPEATAEAIAKVQASAPPPPPDLHMLLAARIVRQTYINSGQAFPPAWAQEHEAEALARVIAQYFPRP